MKRIRIFSGWETPNTLRWQSRALVGKVKTRIQPATRRRAGDRKALMIIAKEPDIGLTDYPRGT